MSARELERIIGETFRPLRPQLQPRPAGEPGSLAVDLLPHLASHGSSHPTLRPSPAPKFLSQRSPTAADRAHHAQRKGFGFWSKFGENRSIWFLLVLTGIDRFQASFRQFWFFLNFLITFCTNFENFWPKSRRKSPRIPNFVSIGRVRYLLMERWPEH